MAGPRGGGPSLLIGAALIVGVCGSTPVALAQGANDYPIPSTASEAYSPIREGFSSPIAPRDDLRGPRAHADPREARLEARRRERWRGLPAFVRDTDLRAHSRTYGFDEDRFGLDRPRALTTGGSLTYQSGAIFDFFQLRGALYTSQELAGNADAGQTENLAPDGDGLTTLGQINGRVTVAGQQITVGRQLVRTPYINPFDIRMIPLTFEGVVLLPDKPGADRSFDYIASYLTRYKPLNETGFIPFSEGLGVTQDAGVLVTGASYHANGLNVGFSNYWIEDTLNTAYGEIDTSLPLGLDREGLGVRVGVNTLDQRTVGADLIAGAPYETYQASARMVASYAGFVFTLAGSQTGSAASIQQPFGFGTSYTSMILTDFEQAGVRAAMLSLSYDLATIGLEGVKVFAAWGWGEGKPSAANGGFADQEELDLRFVYAPKRGRLVGLRFELEYIDWRVPDAGFPGQDLDQFRVIANYNVPLL